MEFWRYPEEVLRVEEFVKTAINILGMGTYRIAKKEDKLYEASLLKLDISKALNDLRWKPRLTTKEAILCTLKWYKELINDKKNIIGYSRKSIHDYLNLIES